MWHTEVKAVVFKGRAREWPAVTLRRCRCVVQLLELRVYLFTIFLLLHLITKCPVILVMVMFCQHTASHLLKCCTLQAQKLIHVATCLLQNQNQRQHLFRMERKGEAMQMMNLTPTLPALLMSSSSGDWYVYIFGLWLLLTV